MGKLFLALLIGLVGAAIVHIAIVFSIPLQAENDAWGRLSRLGALFAVVRIEDRPNTAGGDAQEPGFAFVDPAFIDSACRFSLEDGPVRLTADERTGFWTASVYARNGDNLYSISERVALEGALDLLIGTREQLDLARVEGTELPDQTVTVELATDEGYVMVRSLVDSRSERPFVDRFVRSITCRPATDEEAGRPASG
ncbi:DUF1254 domain-containing protein [Aureimonas flava]|uniref:DUF1254 domain-containing protein n=1 Tax=Aureimonas flava TaxID=2320271 RepID=A0A3A1WLD3_9HYPH|nr:DUF1254 domain-containing protein [Aureimonas flava]RIY01278.1 DUF1254 domain-containing protein [Aureimonas flava]